MTAVMSAQSVRTAVTIIIDGIEMSEIILAFTDSVRTRHHFEMFLSDWSRQKTNCTKNISINSAIDYEYNRESFRPVIPVSVNGIKAFATLIDEVMNDGYGQSSKYLVNIRMRHTDETHKFGVSIGLLLERPGPLLLSGIVLDLNKSRQKVEATAIYEMH